MSSGKLGTYSHVGVFIWRLADQKRLLLFHLPIHSRVYLPTALSIPPLVKRVHHPLFSARFHFSR